MLCGSAFVREEWCLISSQGISRCDAGWVQDLRLKIGA